MEAQERTLGQGYSSVATIQQRQQRQQSHHASFSTAAGCLTDYDPNLNSVASTSSASTSYTNVILVPPQSSSSGGETTNDELNLDDQSSFILSHSDARFLNSFVRQNASASGPPPSYEEHQVVAADLNQLSISPNDYQLVHQDSSDDYVQQNEQIIFRNGRFYQNVSLLETNPDDDSVELVSEVQAMLNNYAAEQVNFSDIDTKNGIVEFNLDPMSVVFKEEARSNEYTLVTQSSQDGTIITDLEKYSPQFKTENNVLDSIGPVLDREQERLLLENTMSPLLAAVNNVTATGLIKMEQYTSATSNQASLTTSSASTSTATTTLSGLDLFGHIVEAMPSSIPTVVESINNRNINIIEGSTELIISNSYVPCRAYASLPTNYLHFRRETDTNEIAPYASKIIPNNTKFGPFEGIVRSVSPIEMQSIANDMLCNRRISLLILSRTQILDVTDEKMSNWMRYVRITRSLTEQNLALIETSGQLFFKSCKTIKPKERLLFNFSADYRHRFLDALLNKATTMLMSPVKTETESDAQSCHDDGSDSELKLEEKLSDKENMVYNCRLCQKVFADEERFVQHNLIHAEDDRGTGGGPCTRCRKVFSVQSSLEEHMKLHESLDSTTSTEKMAIKLLTCPLCDLKLRRLLFAEHVRSHFVNGFYTCPHCNKKFKKYYLIRKHIRNFHPDIEHPCDQCDKSFKTSTKLKLHQIRHSDKREFLCSECGKMLKRKDKLNEHIRRFHSGEHSLEIETPPVQEKEKKPRLKRTKKIDEDSFEAAVTVAEKKRKQLIKSPSSEEYERFVYKCHDCRLGFKRRGMLVNHLHKRHPEVPIDSVPELNLPIMKEQKCYYCQFCDKVYKSSSKRKAHIMKYHPNSIDLNEVRTYRNPAFSETVGSITTEPQACPWCYKQYASKTKLIQHQRIKHPEQMKEANWSNSSTESNVSTGGRPTLLRQNAVIETGVQEVRQPSFENFEVTDKNFYDIDYQLKKSGGSFDSQEVPQQQQQQQQQQNNGSETDLTELTITQTDLLELENGSAAGKISALFDDVDFMQLKAVELQCSDYFTDPGTSTLDLPSSSTSGLVSSNVRIDYTHGAG